MVTKIKPRRIKSDNPGSLGDFLGYQDEANFLWGQGGGGQIYTAGRGIAILNGLDYSAMRGPCDEGFHIPMRSEGNALCNILTNTFGFVNQSSTLETYVKMPMAGTLSSSDASYFGVGQYGYYRTCETLTDFAYYMYGGPLTIGCDSATSRSSGNSIRQFKDTPVIPDGGSTWTTIYDGSSIATGAGIFHNTTSGIISLSGDGINWITIADKNLGATQVYNNGDTLSESNCGKYYQWGNNYGFDGIGGSTPTTSATKVDASSYGPGNFYSSSTYITTSASPYDWSSVQNNNLWGGETGVVTLNNAITNTGVLSVNGQTGDVTIPTTEESNTKTFYPENNQDLNTWQQAYDWAKAGNEALVYATNGNHAKYLFRVEKQNGIPFMAVGLSTDADEQSDGTVDLRHPINRIYSTNDVVTGIGYNLGNYCTDLVKKQYVDDSISAIVIPTYTAGENISIDVNNEISAIDTTYSAGTGINIDANNEIINTGVLSVNSNTGAINLKTINSTSIIGTGDIITPITTVEDNLTSTSTTNALSANQGRILDGKIADLMALGKFLSLWNATTGQPISFPYTTPYAYTTGDYFLVEVVDTTTNYRPNGSSYTGIASTTVETDELEQGDVYIYDGSVWLLQSNHGKTVTFANIAGQPTDNTNLATALAAKQDNLTAGIGISISGNTVTNTGVTSVNGNNGVVTVTEANDSTITFTQGGVTKGSFTTNQSSNSTIALDEGKVYNAGPGISIGDNYLAMQGPAPAGYHIPTKSELSALYIALVTDFELSANASTMKTYLKMPLAGFRATINGSTANQGAVGVYWSSTPYETNKAYSISFTSTTLNSENNAGRANGYSIRCFKNTPVTPDSTWTQLTTPLPYDMGVFHNSTLSLISIVYTGGIITISDKNLGATVVYNDGDTLAESNCGKYYQRGNDNGFDWTGTITTSSTQVDASSYGPSYHYSDSTFIYGSTDWSSVQNDNLWGGVTGINAIINTGIQNDTTGTTTTVTKIWAGTEAEYNALSTHDTSTIYHIY